MNQPSIVTALEEPYPAYSGTMDASHILLAGLQWPTEYWVGLALGWLEQGAPISQAILKELQCLATSASLSQSVKHRAFGLVRQTLQSLPIEELDVVRVVALHQVARIYGGTATVERVPQVGDVGTVVHVYQPTSTERRFEVEAVDKDGFTLWIADFDAMELRLELKHFQSGA
ncbi:hypothetical protein [Ideonella paludis]|uniref:DUF4926 domain-containing protein n=1 Tax=Ideonella paludis TaxID=1233411 RepID=A0ABS5DZ77_9BURK|nr:hypothetical protein [Ideonella paludis]MBQ0936379.1 hypothetical protein [Ideonella paludis]